MAEKGAPSVNTRGTLSFYEMRRQQLFQFVYVEGWP